MWDRERMRLGMNADHSFWDYVVLVEAMMLGAGALGLDHLGDIG
jgi:hypothetical protein